MCSLTEHIDRIETALDAALGTDVRDCSRDELAGAVLALQRLRAKLEAVTCRVIDVFDAESVWADRGAANAASWIRVLAKVPSGVATRQVRHARALRSLPATSAALARGEITGDHVSRIVDADSPRTREALRRDETEIVSWATTFGFARFCQRVRWWVHLNDHDGVEPDAANNDVSLSQTFFGTWRLDGWLDPVTGAVVNTELRRLEQQLFHQDWSEACTRYGTTSPTPQQLARSAAQRRADALAEMARRSAGAGRDPTRTRVSVTVLVGAQRLEQVCELLDGTVVHPADVARWLPASLVQRIVFDGDDHPVAASAQRSFRGVLRKAIQIVHRECAHEVCDRPAEWCDVDHVMPVHRGGVTRFDLGRPACALHNRRRTYRDHDPPAHDRWKPHPATALAER